LCLLALGNSGRGKLPFLGIFEHNYHPRIYRGNEDATILQVGDSELDFNLVDGHHWWQNGRRNVRVWPR
jgi:hypothetical protein